MTDQFALCDPLSVDVDSTGNVYITDFARHGVLLYKDALATDFAADAIIGAAELLVRHLQPGGITATNVCYAVEASTGPGGILAVSDTNHRILLFFSPEITDLVADREIGQRNAFNASACNAGGVARLTSANRGALPWMAQATYMLRTRSTIACSNTTRR